MRHSPNLLCWLLAAPHRATIRKSDPSGLAPRSAAPAHGAAFLDLARNINGRLTASIRADEDTLQLAFDALLRHGWQFGPRGAWTDPDRMPLHNLRDAEALCRFLTERTTHDLLTLHCLSARQYGDPRPFNLVYRYLSGALSKKEQARHALKLATLPIDSLSQHAYTGQEMMVISRTNTAWLCRVRL